MEPLAALVVGPDRHVLEVLIKLPHFQLLGDDATGPRGVDDKIALQRATGVTVFPTHDDGTAVAVGLYADDFVLLADIGTALAGGVQEDLIEFGAGYLVGVVVHPRSGLGC